MNGSRFCSQMLVSVCLVALLDCPALAHGGQQPGDSTVELQSGHLEFNVIQETTEARFRAELHNAGTQALVLNLGAMLGNGRKQYANSIHLLLISAHGKQLHLELLEPPTINGRVDPMVMPLPPGATFTLLIDLRNYIAPREKVWDLALDAGDYTLTAEYKGVGVSQASSNLDMKGIALMPYWIGEIDSPALRFTLTQKVGGRQQ